VFYLHAPALRRKAFSLVFHRRKNSFTHIPVIRKMALYEIELSVTGKLKGASLGK